MVESVPVPSGLSSGYERGVAQQEGDVDLITLILCEGGPDLDTVRSSQRPCPLMEAEFALETCRKALFRLFLPESGCPQTPRLLVELRAPEALVAFSSRICRLNCQYRCRAPGLCGQSLSSGIRRDFAKDGLPGALAQSARGGYAANPPLVVLGEPHAERPALAIRLPLHGI